MHESGRYLLAGCEARKIGEGTKQKVGTLSRHQEAEVHPDANQGTSRDA